MHQMRGDETVRFFKLYKPDHPSEQIIPFRIAFKSSIHITSLHPLYTGVIKNFDRKTSATDFWKEGPEHFVD